eukprot:COSAG01_NODE_3271_length_6320_cov_8.998554_7_plen_92_part_00
MSRAFPAYARSILTEIYLCHACSCHKIEDGNAWTGIGQGAAVNIHYLIAPGSIDDVMWSTLERKVQTLGQALDGRCPPAPSAVAEQHTTSL